MSADAAEVKSATAAGEQQDKSMLNNRIHFTKEVKNAIDQVSVSSDLMVKMTNPSNNNIIPYIDRSSKPMILWIHQNSIRLII